MKLIYVNTEDGKTSVQLWEASDFQDRHTRVINLDTGVTETDIVIPDNLVICDFCNEQVTEYPVPVLWGSYALCPKCFKEVQR